MLGDALMTTLLLAEHDNKSLKDSTNKALTAVKFRVAKAHAVESFERAYLAELLGRTHGNITLAARIAGKERSRFSKLIRKYGFHGEAFRSGC